jgi:hypothetical protein
MSKINFGNAWTAPYGRLTQPDSGLIWSVAAGSAGAATAWADSDIALVWSALLGKWVFEIPSALPAGEWDLDIYDAAVPAATDTIVLERRIRVSSLGKLSTGSPNLNIVEL